VSQAILSMFRDKLSTWLRRVSTSKLRAQIQLCRPVFPGDCPYPEGTRLTVAYADRSLFLWDTKDPAHVGRLRSFLAHSGAVWGVAPLPPASWVPGGAGSGAPPTPPGTFATSSAAGAYTRPLVSSTKAVSASQNTSSTPSKA
jgi:hypothetical protein